MYTGATVLDEDVDPAGSTATRPPISCNAPG